MKIHDVEQIYNTSLSKLLSAERPGLQAYDALLNKAENPELKKALQQHRKEAERQVHRLEQIIQKSGTSAKIEDQIVPAILREGEKMADMTILTSSAMLRSSRRRRSPNTTRSPATARLSPMPNCWASRTI